MYFTFEGYLKDYAKKNNLILPSDYMKKLLDLCNAADQGGHSFIFPKVADPIYRTRVLDASSKKGNKIWINANWVKVLLFHYDNEAKEAFKYTIGHEITHKSGEYSEAPIIGKKRMLVDWVRETRADFGGAKLMLNGDRNAAIRAHEFKEKWNTESAWRKFLNQIVNSHPTVEKRIYYLKNYDFDEKLIRKISKDLKYKSSDESLVQTICDYYKGHEIILTPPIESTSE